MDAAIRHPGDLPRVPERVQGARLDQDHDRPRRALEGYLFEPDLGDLRLRAGLCHRAAGRHPDGVV